MKKEAVDTTGRIADLQAVEIEINSACNRSCSYCPNSLETRGRELMTRDLYETVLFRLNEISFAGRISFNFYNEPLLHPDLAYFCQRTKEVLPGTFLDVYTNGTLLTLKKFIELEAAGIDRFVITRHEMEMADDYTFEETFQSLSAAQKTKVIYRDFNAVTLFNRGGLLPHLGKGLDLHPCHLPKHLIVITVNGNILPCFEDFKESKIFGNVLTESLPEIWHNSAYANFRKDLERGLRHLHSPCKGCNRSEVLPPFNI